ncbi:competence protein ComFA [Virgibacillus halotolerans]|uniref:DEAD/DEAH box helicase n=1 Tax=Virgibacillus halotolerans TaxID=1071053 RepID=UPI001960907B|nr:DEAD/DEAH box helicase [Virgibacillus halotolerans]MBM7600532.1 competence protein ComFA [Virgibacillus halotolerans]
MDIKNTSHDSPPLEIYARQFSGKLLLRTEILLDENTFQQLLSLHLFTPVQSIKRKKFTYQCQRCGNQKRSLFATLPRTSGKKILHYCRNCIEMGRVIDSEPLYYWTGKPVKWLEHEAPCTWDGQLTAAQQRAADHIVNAVNNHQQELLIWAVCGAGKTEMLFPGMATALSAGKRICIATPRADVVRELMPRLQKAFQHVPVQGLYGGSKDRAGTAQIIIATTHQLLRYREAFDLLIIDEIDAFPFHADASLPFAANRAKAPQHTTIYLTATPRQEQRRQMVGNKLPHIFVPIRFHGHPLPVPTMKMSFSLKKELQKSEVPLALMKWLKNRKHQTRQLLIFVPTIQLADNMRDQLFVRFRKEGLIKSTNELAAVHAQDPDRTEKVQAFRKKDILIMITTTILERGVTFPSVDVVILDAGHEVFDEAALVQIAGRAGRSPDDPTGEVVFFHDGRTDAMVEAVDSIRLMNKRGGFH